MLNIDNLDAAQRKYDSMIPEECEQYDKPAFDKVYDTECFIKDFANTKGAAHEELENLGCNSDGICIASDVLRNMCRVWVQGSEGKEQVYNIAGTAFFKAMSELAEEAYFS